MLSLASEHDLTYGREFSDNLRGQVSALTALIQKKGRHGANVLAWDLLK
jgi:hypothetical protein